MIFLVFYANFILSRKWDRVRYNLYRIRLDFGIREKLGFIIKI